MNIIKCKLRCSICEKEIEKTKKEIEKSKHKLFYCSQECMGKSRKKSQILPCKVCGVLKEQPLVLIKNNDNLFCSRKCYDDYQKKNRINLTCKICGNSFFRVSSQFTSNDYFCSPECRAVGSITSIKLNCTECNKEIVKTKSIFKNSKSNRFFCSGSCCSKYYKRNQNFGYNRSKFEIWLEEKLSTEFPNLKILFNDKSLLKYEVDIYIPALNVVFEINGITHYKAIFGEKRYQSTIFLDNYKKEYCIKNSINFYVIDVSEKLNKIDSEKRIMDNYKLISDIINEKTNRLAA